MDNADPAFIGDIRISLDDGEIFSEIDRSNFPRFVISPETNIILHSKPLNARSNFQRWNKDRFLFLCNNLQLCKIVLNSDK